MTSRVGPVVLRAPAKINLGLRLVGQRSDGYHLLESVFAPLELADEIEIELLSPPTRGNGASSIALAVEIDPAAGLPDALAGVGAGPDNLAARAARDLLAASGLEAELTLRLRKSIPAGAGLGGGSSDAAAVLSGLADLLGAARPADPGLAEIALGIGADVPFFLRPQLSHVAGIGEELEPLEGLPDAAILLANPGISLGTAEVYRAADALGAALTDPGAGSTMRAFSRLRDGLGDPRETPRADESGAKAPRADPSRALWKELLINDLTPAARRLCPPVGRLLEKIERTKPLGSSLSGSGATVFGVYETEAEARRAGSWLMETDTSFASSGQAPQRESNNERAADGAEHETKEANRPWVQVTRFAR